MAEYISDRIHRKQIPAPVLYEVVGYDIYGGDNIYACICPSCQLHIFEFTDSDLPDYINFDFDVKELFHSCLVPHDYRGLNNFCNRCGQRLDWR